MYLHELFVKNSGPLRQIHINFDFDGDSRPIPYVFVGTNGSGKTNLLSIIADALIHGASSVFTDVVAPYAGGSRSYFRIVGGRALTNDQPGGFSILRFSADDDDYFFTENTGAFSPTEARELVPDSLKAGANWNVERQEKKFKMPAQKVQKIYGDGAYAFFPSSRFEYPSWLNRKSLVEDTYAMEERYTNTLNKPMYVEHGIDEFAQWVLGLITDSRMPVSLSPAPEGGHIQATRNGYYDPRSLQTLEIANSVLRIIMNDPTAKFFWAGRHDRRKVGVWTEIQPPAGGLDALSGGQTSLLSIFGTILRYADSDSAMPLNPAEVRGVIVIDELDAHMHIDLQMLAIPKLIAMFPRVQFIMSSHSPIFTLGMEKQFPNGLNIIELPQNVVRGAEAYEEFGRALDAFRETQTFEREIRSRVTTGETPIVLLGGPTDVLYFKKAAELLGYQDLKDYFECVGSDDDLGGKNAGDNNLTAAAHFLQANPSVSGRKVVVVYDCDATRIASSDDTVSVIQIDHIPGRKARKGIENLLPDSALSPDFYHPATIRGDYGEEIKRESFKKKFASERLCDEDADPANFQDFRPILARIKELLKPDPDEDTQDDPPTADGER